jgi:4-alpha-glucanotransferase
VTSSAASFPRGRHAGLLLPLFSAASAEGWGIGEIPDLVTLAAWQRRAGLDFLLMLPVNELAPQGHHSPYATLSAMAIDPIYLRLVDIPEFVAGGGVEALPAELRVRLAAVRQAPQIDYDAVREVKQAALRASFDRFDAEHWRPQTTRAAELLGFVEREADWLDDYALFRALRDRFTSQPWWDWPDGLSTRQPSVLAIARRSLEREIRFHAYLQWLADAQWQAARAAAGIKLFGDLPFVVGADSADVWQHQDKFDRRLSVGTPPDAFSADGQDWGLPAYRWDLVERDDFGWLRARARRGTELFDGYRVDHVIGFYRTYVRDADNVHDVGRFTPEDPEAQKALGRRIMQVFQGSGAAILAEDLGTVPDFLRESLNDLGVPGYKVFRWERAWKTDGQPFLDPRGYAALSVTTTGTHDTESLAEWWDAAPVEERAEVLKVPDLAGAGFSTDSPFDARLRDALLAAIYRSGANLVLLPIQDIFGWRDRINVPGTVGSGNWTWRLPFPLGDLLSLPDAVERASFLRNLAIETGRTA